MEFLCLHLRDYRDYNGVYDDADRQELLTRVGMFYDKETDGWVPHEAAWITHMKISEWADEILTDVIGTDTKTKKALIECILKEVHSFEGMDRLIDLFKDIGADIEPAAEPDEENETDE
jgi:hypothetical protein